MRRRTSPTTIIVIIVASVVGICCLGAAGIGFLGYRFITGAAKPLAECTMNFSLVQQAVDKYAEAHGGKLPSAATWQDDVRPYFQQIAGRRRDFGPFQVMDPNGDWGCTSGDTKTGMAFNSDLSGKERSQLASQYDAILLFEIEAPKRNAAEPYKPRTFAASPKFMGKPRGWFVVPLNGQPRAERGIGSGGSE
jgi:hypothetical protein